MRGAIFQLWCILAVLLAGMHAPASAHDGYGPETAKHLMEFADPLGPGDYSDRDSVVPGQELMHYHHYLMVVDFAGSRPLAAPFVMEKAPRPGLVQALASRALAPPLHPPAA